MAYQDPGPGSAVGDGTTGTTDVAKEQAGRVGQTTSQAAGQVAQTTREQAQDVVGEAKQQARDLAGEARTQVRDQAGRQQARAVQGLHALGDELDQMASQGGQSGLATEVARQVSGRTRDLARYLEGREPADLLDEIRAYARRRPVVFLAGAALAGVVAGRLTKGIAAGGVDDGGPRSLTPGYDTGERYGGQYGTDAAPGYPSPAYEGAGYQGAGSQGTGYPSPAYEGAGYRGAGYESSDDDSTGDRFRSTDAGGTAYPPAPDQGYAPAPDPSYQADPSPAPDPTLDPQQPPARGWTP